MLTKKAIKQLKKLPKSVALAARDADESPTFGRMLRCSNKTRVSIELPGRYRLIKDRDTDDVVWVGSHQDYNKLITSGGKV